MREISDIKDKFTLLKHNPIKISVSRRDKKIWCEYDQDCGHTTHDCREIKRTLDKLADEGKVNQYTKNPMEKKRSLRERRNQEAMKHKGSSMSLREGTLVYGVPVVSLKKHLYTLKHGTTDMTKFCSMPPP